MKAEGDGDGRVTRRGDGALDPQDVAAQGDRHRDAMGEREDLEQVRVRGPVELGVEPCHVLVGARARDLPVRAGRDRAVDRQAVRVAVQQGRAAVEAHGALGDGVAPPADPVRPRVQQRDAEHAAAVEIRVEVTEDAEQLHAVMAQRAADHPGPGREARDEAAARHAELLHAQIAVARHRLAGRRRHERRRRACGGIDHGRSLTGFGLARVIPTG